MRCIIDAANAHKILDLSFMTLVHCTHTADEDGLEYLRKGGMVCVCPLTEGSLADGIPTVEYQAAAGQVVVGSDSNLRIDFLEELRWLEYGQRLRTTKRGHYSVDDLMKVGGVNGAKSLGLVGKVGEFK